MVTDIAKYEFKAGLPQEFEVVDIAELYKKYRNTITTPHRAEFYHIIWFEEGCPMHLVDFDPVKIKPNTILFLSKDIIHCFDRKTTFEGKAILFTDSFFCRTETDTRFLRNTVLFNYLFSVTQIQLTNESEKFSDLLQQMTDELKNNKDHLQADILHNLLHNFLLYSERERHKQNFDEIKKDEDLDYVMLFKDLLESRYKNQKQVKYYAKQIIVTEKRLNQATAKILGKTPKQIIDQRIMLEAKRILSYTTYSVKAIGYILGFKEPTNFIKFFKKHSQCTPTEFREKNTLA